MVNLQKERDLAVDLAVQGGHAIQEAFSASSSKAIQRRWPEKRKIELKTEIDKIVDVILTQGIQDTFPSDAIHSEESAFRPGTSGRIWVNDPIDGTLNLQNPLFGMFAVCVALAIQHIPVLGVAFSPNVQTGQGGKIWIGEQGKKSLYSPDYPNVEPAEIHVSDRSIRNQAIGAADGGKFNRIAIHSYLAKLEHDTNGVTYVYRIGSASMELAAVANGDLDFRCGTSLAPEDAAAMIPILQGAGAVITTLDGRPWTIDEPTILAANPILHADLLEYLKS